MSLISISKLSGLTGFDRRTISARLSMIPPKVDGRSHLYESQDVLPLLYGGLEEQSAKFDLTEERARFTHHQANNEALKEYQLRGSLIPENVIREHGAGMVSAFRSKMLALTTKIRNRFSDLSDDVIDEIQRLVNEALEELGSDGIPAEVRERIRRHLLSNEATAEPND